MAALETRHLSILLTDIKGFTDKTNQKSRADIQTMLDEHRAVVLPILEKGGGRLIKTIGDAFLMTFESPTNAVLAGVAVQEALTKLNEGRSPEDRLEIRIAINSGEINLVEGDVFGEPVNITARIEGIAEAGQVYFTEAVYLAMNKAEVPSSEVGLMQLKGIPEKIRVYKVRREDPIGAASAAAPERASGLRRFLPPMTGGTAAAAFGPGVKAVPVAALTLPAPKNRAAALVIDAVICLVVLEVFLSGSILDLVTGGRDFAAVWFVYNLLFLKWISGSPGKQLMKLRVVSTDGLPMHKRQRFIRAAFSLISGYSLLIGYLWGFWDPQARTWHDHMAGTRVVPAE